MAARILVCDDESSLREMLGVLLRRAGYSVELVANVGAALQKIQGQPAYDAVISDLALPDGTGLDVLEQTRKRDDTTQVVIITAYGTTENAVQAMRLGAYDYIQKPFRNHELLALLEKALEKQSLAAENRVLRARIAERERPAWVFGNSPAMQRVVEMVRRVAAAKTNVLITGESGTGKEVIARALHQMSERAAGPFVTVNCGAIPEALMESELFGHEKGSFTGAIGRREGLFRMAEGGTLFLDEIGELALPLQVKLLRALQERRVRPIGGAKEIEFDVRVVAATNRDLEREVEANQFRSDLFYRLNVIRIELPPLRERHEDIAPLAEHFLHKHAIASGRNLRFAPEALRWIATQPYPGNVRELENVVERAATLALHDEVTLEDLHIGPPTDEPLTPLVPTQIPAGFDIDAWLGELERGLLLRAIQQTKGNQTAAARLLGTTFRSLRYRLRKFGLAEDTGTEGP